MTNDPEFSPSSLLQILFIHRAIVEAIRLPTTKTNQMVMMPVKSQFENLPISAWEIYLINHAHTGKQMQIPIHRVQPHIRVN